MLPPIPLPIILSLIIIVVYTLYNYGYRIRFPHLFASTSNVNDQISNWSDDLSVSIIDLYQLKNVNNEILFCLFGSSKFQSIKGKLTTFYTLYENIIDQSKSLTKDEQIELLSEKIMTIFSDHENFSGKESADFKTTQRSIFELIIFLCKNFCDFKTAGKLYYNSFQFEGLIEFYETVLFKLPKSKLLKVKNDQSVYNNDLLYFLDRSAYDTIQSIDVDNKIFSSNNSDEESPTNLIRINPVNLNSYIRNSIKDFMNSLDEISNEEKIKEEIKSENAIKILKLFEENNDDQIKNYKHENYISLYEFMNHNNIISKYVDNFDHTRDLFKLEKTLYDLEGNGGKGLLLYEEIIIHSLMKKFHIYVIGKVYNKNQNEINKIYKNRNEIIQKGYVKSVHSLNKLQVYLAIDLPRILAYNNSQSKNFKRDKYIMVKLQFKYLMIQMMAYINIFDIKNIFSSNELTFHRKLNNPVLNILINMINSVRSLLNFIINDPSKYITDAFSNV